MVSESKVRRIVERMVETILGKVNEVLEENNQRWQAGYDALEARVDEQALVQADLKRRLDDIEMAWRNR